VNRGHWPPDDEGRARDPANAQRAVTQPPDTDATDTLQRRIQSSGNWSHLGHAGDVFRFGFGHGFRDALAMICRAVPDPAVWAAAHHLTGSGDG
jgi:hypothetical protein